MKPDWISLFSDNIKPYEGYSIGKLFKLLRDREIISLAGGLPSPDMFLKDELRWASTQRLQEDIEKIMQYTDISGETGLKEAIIEFLKTDQIHISSENILVTSSAQQGLDLVGRLFLNPEDVILMDRPTFAGAIVAFQMQRPLFAGVDIEDDGSNIWEFREKIEFFKRRNKKPKFIYVVPDFQNPSGITMSLEKREALLELSNLHGIPIVEDSPYRHLRYYGETLPSLFSLDQKYKGENVIGIYTFSKLFCPGMRVGFNIGPEAAVQKMTNIKEGSTLNTPKYNQDMCTDFIRQMDWQGHFRRCRTHYQEKLEVFLESMNRFFPKASGVTWTEPEGGLFLWVTLPENMDTLKLFHEAIKYKVAFVPGNVFYGDHPANNHMRINYSYPSKAQLIEAVKRLASCIKNQPDK